MSTNERGFFTLPGESGYEKLTLKLAPLAYEDWPVILPFSLYRS